MAACIYTEGSSRWLYGYSRLVYIRQADDVRVDVARRLSPPTRRAY